MILGEEDPGDNSMVFDKIKMDVRDVTKPTSTKLPPYGAV